MSHKPAELGPNRVRAHLLAAQILAGLAGVIVGVGLAARGWAVPVTFSCLACALVLVHPVRPIAPAGTRHRPTWQLRHAAAVTFVVYGVGFGLGTIVRLIRL